MCKYNRFFYDLGRKRNSITPQAGYENVLRVIREYIVSYPTTPYIYTLYIYPVIFNVFICVCALFFVILHSNWFRHG